MSTPGNFRQLDRDKNNISKDMDTNKVYPGEFVELSTADKGQNGAAVEAKDTGSSSGGSEEEKKDDKPANMVGMAEVFRFSDAKDKLLIICGIIAACLQGAALPAMMILFGDMTDLFIYDALYVNWINENWETIDGVLDNEYNKTEVIDDPSIITGELEECVSNPNYTALPAEECVRILEQMEEHLMDDFFDQMKIYAQYYAILGCCVMLIAYVQQACFHVSSLRQCLRIRTKLFRAVLRQEIGWFDVHEVGELNTRLTDDVNKIYEGIGDKFGMVFQMTSAFFAGFIIGFIYGWQLTLVIVAISPLLAISGGIMGKLGTALTAKELKAYAKAGAVAEEVLGSMRTVVAFGGQKKESKRYDSNLVEAKTFGIRKGFVNGASMGVIFFVMFGSYALAFWYGTELFLEKNYSPGDVLIVFFCVLIGAFSIGSAGPNIQSYSTARGAAYVVYQLIDQVPAIDSSDPAGDKPSDIKGNIEFRGVKFNYPSRPDVPILTGLDLEVNVGETVALVGPSGCGKSTTVQLLQRFYDPLEGQVLIDGKDVRDYNLKWLRTHIGVVSQEPVLFDTTIEENIRYGRDGVTFEEIEKAARMANAHDFISQLPKKYETLVGERGAQLSGGQKQRIAIARALVRDPKILLLDEATSALDTQSEAVVQAALDKARQGRTTIIIAHRLSTIKTADVIAGFCDGHVVEKGTHNELMQNSSIYYTLVTNQSQSQLGNEIPIKDKSPADFVHSLSMTSVNGDKNLTKIISTESQDLQDDDDEEKYPEVGMQRLLALNSSEAPYIILGCFGALIAGGIQPSFAIIFSELLGVFSITDEDEYRSQANLYSLMFLVIAVGAALSMFTQSYFFAKSGEVLTKRLRQMTFKALLRQDMSYFDDPLNSTGAICARLATEASAVQGATGARLGTVVQSVCTLTCGLTIGFVYSWKLALVVLAFLPLLAVTGYFRARLMSGKGRGLTKKTLEDSGKIAVQCIENIRTVASLSKEEYFCQQYHDLLLPPTEKNKKRTHLDGFIFGFSQSIIFFANAASFVYGGYLIENEGLHYENVFRVHMAIAFSAVGVGQANSFAPDYAKAKKAASKLFHFFDTPPKIDSYSEDGKKLESVVGRVSTTDLRFSYPSRPKIPVLQGVTLEAPPNKRLALVGGSGCGKSTVIQLVERFYDPSNGSVNFDNEDIKSLHIQWMRSQLGIVSQEPVLFDCSIRDNIAYGDNTREVSMTEIIDAAKQANIHNFIENLPEGYETRVGDRGTQLSGGQKQRIAIARALVRKPRVLLLDEATSALDTESEKIVQEALDKAQDGRTSIVIAHRLSTIQTADCIIVIDNGKVAEVGTHSEMMARQGHYYRLNNTQLHQS